LTDGPSSQSPVDGPAAAADGAGGPARAEAGAVGDDAPYGTGPDGLLVLDAAAVRALLPPELAMASQREAFLSFHGGVAQLPPRLVLPDSGSGYAFCYASRLGPAHGAVVKFGSFTPDNRARGLPAVSAVVVVQDPVDGRPAALVEGTSLTAVRTAAASAVAALALKPAGAVRLAVIGAGVQGRAHIHSLAAALELTDVRIFDPNRGLADVAEQEAGAAGLHARLASSSADAAADADVVVCCTTSSTPVLDAADVRPGALVISVGSVAEDRCEVPVELLGEASVVVDSLADSVAQCGPVVQARKQGLPGARHLLTLGSVLAGESQARSHPEQTVVFLTLGLGVQDAAAAAALLRSARTKPDLPRLVW